MASCSFATIDDRVLLWVHHHLASHALDDVARAVTAGAGASGITIVIAALVCWTLALRRTNDAIVAMCAIVSAKLVNFTLKYVFDRPRPHQWHTIVTEHTPSLPSGHSAGAAAVAMAAILLAWHTRWRLPVTILALTYALLIGSSRIYLGVHYPSDVLVGWGVGGGWVALCWWMYRRWRRE